MQQARADWWISRAARVMVAGLVCWWGVGETDAQTCMSARWVNVDPFPNGPCLMAYDSRRDVTVALVSGVTWESTDGAHWTRRTAAGPGVEFIGEMAYDASRGVCVMVRGGDEGVRGTWEWDGESWTRAGGGTDPVMRSGQAMAYDSIRGRVLLFGGRDAASVNHDDTWAWDGRSWELISASGPGARAGGAMAFDAVRDRMVMQGGVSGTVSHRDTWEFDGAQWVQRHAEGPRLYEGRMAYDAARGVMVCSSGYGTSEWNGTDWTAVIPYGAEGIRWRFGMVFDARAGRVILACGGTDETPSQLDQVWEWNGAAWTTRDAPAVRPIGRRRPAMVYDNIQGRAIFHGGLHGFADAMAESDTWAWDGDSWTRLTTDGPQRWEHAMAFDRVRGVVVLFGGRLSYADPAPTGGTWEFDGVTWTLRTSSGPAPFAGASMSFDRDRGVCVMFREGETWEWNGTAWTLRATSGPLPRYGAAMVYDPDRHVTVLHGGHKLSFEFPRTLGDMWEWNGSAWTKVGSASRPRYFHAMVYDTSAETLRIYGGSTDESGTERGLNDTLEWNGTDWDELFNGTGPGYRGGAGSMFDEAREEFVIFAGGDDVVEAPESVWVRTNEVFSNAPSIIDGPVDRTIQLGDRVTMLVAAEGRESEAMSYQWRRNKAPVENTNHVSGARSRVLTITDTQVEHAGEYDVVVTNPCGSTTSGRATLTVIPCTADFNADGLFNSQDFFDFLGAFFAGAPAADFNRSGTVDSQDFFDFLEVFFAGPC